MELKINFEEIGSYIQKHYDKTVSFSMVSTDEVCITYKQNLFIASIPVPVNIKIVSIEPHLITLSYNGKLGIDVIIKGVLAFLMAKLPELSEAITTGNGNIVSVDLSCIKQAKALVENVAFKHIQFLNDGIMIIADLL